MSGYYKVLLGGAKPPSALPDNVSTTWGMTETGSGVVYDGTPLPSVDVSSVDGQLCVRTPTLFRSYRSEPRPTILGPDGRDDWFPTGDAGGVTNGIVAVRGRLGFLINTGGEKLWPEDLETALATIKGVRDVAVTSIDDPEWGQRVVALIVTDGSRVDESVRAVAEERIGPWAKPKDIRYVVAIPRTVNGKLRRAHANEAHAVRNGGDNHATDDGIDHLASSSKEARASDNGSGDGLEHEVAAVNPVGDAPQSRGVDQSGNTGGQAREGKRHETEPVDVDAGTTSGLTISANGVDVATGLCLNKDETAGGQDRQHDRYREGHPIDGGEPGTIRVKDPDH